MTRQFALNSTTTDYPTSHTKSGTEPYLTPLFINNEFRVSKATEWYDIHDPATDIVISKCPQTTAEELEEAITNAHEAFKSWKKVSIMRRQQIIFKYVELIKKNHDRLAAVIVAEQGKTFDDAKGDVLRGLQVAEYATSVTTQLQGQQLEVATDMDTLMIREPLGVVAAICPFNFPAMIPLWTIPMVLATGNTAVIKPSERDPGCCSVLAELLVEAGVPPGVINLVQGKVDTVNTLIKHPLVKAVQFVGSSTAGDYIYKTSIAHGKRAQCNEAAKNHVVVLPDANKAQFINATVGAFAGAAGQRCMAASVLVTVGETKEWIDDLIEASKQLKTGSGFDKGSHLGPLISKAALERSHKIIEQGVKQGAKVVLDGRDIKVEGFPDGYFLGPTILTGATPGNIAYDEEIFAPVLCVINVDTLDEAIELVNSNQYGNGVALFTTSGIYAKKFVKEIEPGQVGINVPIPVPLPMFSFTGSKGSFQGDLNFYGQAGLTFLTKPKTITSLWKTSLVEETKPSTSMPTQN
ncbi:ALD6 [Cyberlindnera jadinii]|uniref:methylmalonate-semialdehyde dehydrogenase (CoA acylating) n=1 Tax=Cyberlindnera jadinii (strain ATCC 18201 / CBS 1600 / BCRC 20928 / JCM 3617 / NBRC 0987 / NRRL Y-1542) TaxID=983966 RepID=A0A0H5C005_CYBJN|nr:methylmalonate-semialdehyde dehydrogenase [Cyberlindnera jadinii NRRL Y-1542]ODV76477.1 methylmalonate-semialdehyde dehydrogenase [Cyberlindnera jadinii NRRL Y-1542]CEP21105.1 ALD6 [Cyberlindnera jadinii]